MMTASRPQATFRVLPLVGTVIAGVVAGALAGYAVARLANWPVGASPVNPAVLAIVVWSFAASLGILTIIGGTGRVVERAGLVVVAASFLRMLTALMLGVGAHFVLHPEGKTFWTCFLLAGLGCLVAETVWAMRILNSLRSARAPESPAGAR